VGRADFRLLIDTMHLTRTGSTPADLAAIDPKLIAYLQFCDAPRTPRFPSYMKESMTERMCLGTGDVPLAEILAIVPRDRVVALEVPLLSQAEAGMSHYERLRPCVEAKQGMLAALD